MKKFISPILTMILFLSISIAYSQSFEGTISYKLVANNPNPEGISDSMWTQIIKEQFGERGHILQKFSYKGDQYICEIDAGIETGYQLYNPKDKLLYSWAKDSEEAITLDSRKYMDELTSITEGDKTETILGIECKSIIIKSQLGQMTYWYNSNHLKMDAGLYEGFLYGHWAAILEKTGCLPLKIENDGFMAKTSQVVIEYKEEKIEDKIFELPEFKEISANPMN